jgi:hypothetical protein
VRQVTGSVSSGGYADLEAWRFGRETARATGEMDASRFLKEIVPPAIWRAIGALRRAGRGDALSGRHARGRPPLRVPSEGTKGLNYVTGHPVLLVPLDRIRYPDGRRYTVEEHHFLQYYRAGLPVLRRFYESHRPSNVFELHFLPTPAGPTPPTLEVPWFTEFESTTFRGEGGLGPEHGDQAYGPVSERKLRLEAARLDAVLASIRRHGFEPRVGGHPKGYIMLRPGGAWVFTIREGFHRVAAMAHLGYDAVEVAFSPRVPRFVEEVDVAAWPMVADGVMSADDALALFAQYFRQGWASGAQDPRATESELADRAHDHFGSSTA